jgi:hypothetical protein
MTWVTEPADIDFYFDPVCPFAWMTSKWVRLVMAQRDHTTNWCLISLRVLNSAVDYDSHFPPEYEAGHMAGLRLLRLVACARSLHGPEVVGRLYAALGQRIFDSAPLPEQQLGRGDLDQRGTAAFVAPVLTELDLPASLLAALDDGSFDEEIRAETERALTLAGRDVGTPIIQFRPPDGVAFFGPVISRLPSAEDAVQLWDHVVGLAGFPGFAELKRSLRERPQLRGLGVAEDEAGLVEDWHGGSRRTKR